MGLPVVSRQVIGRLGTAIRHRDLRHWLPVGSHQVNWVLPVISHQVGGSRLPRSGL